MRRRVADRLEAEGLVLDRPDCHFHVRFGAVAVYRASKILYGPAKAANAGGVAVSGLEMAQNSMRMSWSRKELNMHLGDIMKGIHERCVEYGTDPDGYVDYLKGANIAGFKKVADALIAYGAV